MAFFDTCPDFPRNHRGKVDYAYIKQVLTRIFYAGVIDHEPWGISMVQGRHEPLISLETYRAIQDKLAGKSRHKPRAVEDADVQAMVATAQGLPFAVEHGQALRLLHVLRSDEGVRSLP